MANWLKLMKNQDTDYQHNLEFLKLYRETNDKDAQEWLILNNANLVHKIVGNYRTFYNHKLSYDDLFSVGLEGLLRAIDKFDFNYENNFATYASYWIKQSVVRLITDEGFVVKVPTHLFETLQQVVKYETQTDYKITKNELCELLNINNEKYDLIEQVRGYILKWTSLNKPISQVDDTEIGDLINPEHVIAGSMINHEIPAYDAIAKTELQNGVIKALKNLDDREQLIIIGRFGLGGEPVKTLAEIGEQCGISRERTRQIEARALTKLRKAMPEYEVYLH